jgi:hypothetical protein
MKKKFTDIEFMKLAFSEYSKLLQHDLRTTQRQKRILKTIINNEQYQQRSSGFDRPTIYDNAESRISENEKNQNEKTTVDKA